MKIFFKIMSLFYFLVVILFINPIYADIVIREEEDPDTDIQDILLLLAPGLVLNVESPANTFIGDIEVLTYSGNKPQSLYLAQESHYVNLIGTKLYLKDSGNVILQNINHFLFEIKAVDNSNPPGVFSKFLRIPVDHIKEDSVLKVSSIDDLCNTDSNRLLFTLDVFDPNYDPKKPYDCRITRTNYPNIDFVEIKVNNTRYEIYLPSFDSPKQTSFFEVDKKPLLLVEISCSNNMVVTHQRTIDFKICKKILPIENIMLDEGISDDQIIVQFNAPIGTIIARLMVVDFTNRYGDDYEYYLAEPNDFLDVSKIGIIRIKRKLDITLLKYYYPKLRIRVGVTDLTEPGRDISRVFRFSINDTGQPLPSLRFRPDFELIPIFQFAQQAEFLIKLGQFELNSTTYPLDRYDLRLTAGNVTLDDQGNLFIGQDPLNDIDPKNKTAVIALNIYDKKANVSVFEDVFEIEIPDIPTTVAPITGTGTSAAPNTTPGRIPDALECVNDRDCNNQRLDGGPNKCIRLSSLREFNMRNNNDAENTMRLIQFLNNKDASLFLKYNEILLVLQSQSKELDNVLDRYQITQKDLANVGACLCDQDSQGWRCATPLPNDRPHLCHPNSTVPSCVPQNGVCRSSEFFLRNSIRYPSDKLLEYRSYYCECTSAGILGVNCDFRGNPCSTKPPQRSEQKKRQQQMIRQQLGRQGSFLSDPISRYQTSSLGSVNDNQGQCDADLTKDFCEPLVNSTGLSGFKCMNRSQSDMVNYFVFDESYRNPNFANFSDNYKKLNLSDATVAMGIQSFLRDEVIPRYSYNDYSKIPKGPLAIMRPSVNMPNTLNNVRNKVNGLIDRRADNILDQLQNNRVEDMVKDTLLYLIANNLLNTTITPDNLTQTITQLIDKLNLSDLKNFSTPLWSLEAVNVTDDNNDPSGLMRHLNALQSNSDKLTSPDQLGDVLTLKADNQRFIDFFNFSTRPYSLLKLDILPGIFVDSDSELSLRPVPGVFLESIPTDPTSPDRELIFLPGIFNPVVSANCQMKSIFLPGIISLPIDNYDLANLPLDFSRYLNRFVPMQIPFNVNGFLTPYRSSTVDTIAALLLQQNSNSTFNSHLLLTPIDFQPDATFDIITKNEKFMSNLFSNRSFYKIVEEQKQLDTQNLASTLVLSNPTMISPNKQDYLNSGCINQTGFLPKYNGRGTQFYDTTTPTKDVSVLPFVVYDNFGNPIPQSIMGSAIDKYCSSYLEQMNDFHLRICRAQNQTNEILAAQKNGSLCQTCPFTQAAVDYYNPKTVNKKNNLPLLILAAILALLWLLWMLSMLLCCCCRCCPLYGLFCRDKKKIIKEPAFIMKNKSTKIFAYNGEMVDPMHPMHYTLIANGELVRSAPKDQQRLFYMFDNAEITQPSAFIINDRANLISQDEIIVTAPITSANSFHNEKSELLTIMNNKNQPIVNSVQTNSAFLVKREAPRHISSISSSSLVKPIQLAAAHPFVVANSRELILTDTSRKPSMFVTKRIPALQRSASIDFPVIDTEFEQVVSIFKRSSSFPFLDQPNFYRNNRFVDESQPRNVTYRFNRTTMVNEEGKQSWEDNFLTNSTPNLSADPTKNIKFRLKRLSNYIVDPLNPGSIGGIKSQSVSQFRINRMDAEHPPKYRDLRALTNQDENASNELVIDWLLRQTPDDEGRESNSDNSTQPSSNLTVVRIENRNFQRSSLLRRVPSPRCFVCNEKISDIFNNSDESNPDDPIYICDGCYESWYSAPVGVLPNALPVPKRNDEANESGASDASTVYSLTKDNKLNFGLAARKRNSFNTNF